MQPGTYGMPANPPKASSSMVGELSFWRLVRVLKKKWLTIFMSVLFFLVIGFLYVRITPKIYEAECLVEMSLLRPRIMGQRGAVIDDVTMSQSDEIFNTRLEKFRSPAMLDMAASNLQAVADTSAWNFHDLRKMLKKRVEMTLVRRSRLVRITFEHRDPEFAALAANAFGHAAEELAVQENRLASDSAVAWLRDQAANKRAALEKADNAVLEFSKANKLDSLARRKLNVEDALKGFNETLTKIEADLHLARELYNAVVDLELTPESAGQLPDAIPRSLEIQAALEQWLAAISARDALLTKYTAKHPEVVAQEQVIEARRKQAMDALQRARETAGSNLELLEQQAKSLQEKIEEQSRMATDLEMEIVELDTRRIALEREREAADISYKGILNRIEEARLSADENTASVKVISPAREPEKPVWPKLVYILALAFAVGAVGGVGLALVTDTLDDYISNSDDLERELGLRALAVVPHILGDEDDELALASLSNDHGHLVEAFAGIRGLLDAPQHAEHARSVLITSTAPGEGKTLTSCNLAIACARSGNSTLLIDFDLRRPRVASVFNMHDSAPSLLDTLRKRDETLFDSLPQQGPCEGLDIIVTRAKEDDTPADVMGSKIVRDLLKWAENRYDRVIIDSPPFGVIRDAVVLASMVGSVLLVCRSEHSRRGAMLHAIGHFNDVGANLLGLVVNDVDFGSSAYLRFLGTHYSAYSYASYYGPASLSGKKR
jgi:capsular exopolysaccharide synthesis family protein